jgi:acetyl-CoA carboxylase biotin carboxyl carrier protein
MEKKETKPSVVKPESNNTFDISEINELLKAFTKSNVNELKLEKGDFKITIKQGAASASSTVIQQVAPVAAPQAAATAPTPAVAASAPVAATPTPAADNLITIKSPMIGTFYRSAGPDKPTFINVGDNIDSGKVLCIIEAMKLFNEIEAEVKGTIVKVLVDDATPVEYDQPLFLVEPA